MNSSPPISSMGGTENREKDEAILKDNFMSRRIDFSPNEQTIANQTMEEKNSFADINT